MIHMLNGSKNISHFYHISNIADSELLLDKVSIFRVILGSTVAAV